MIFGAFSHIFPYLLWTKLEHTNPLELCKCLTFFHITPVSAPQLWPGETSPAAREHLTSMIFTMFDFLEIANVQNKQDREHFKARITQITARLFFLVIICQERHSSNRQHFLTLLSPNNRETYQVIRWLKQRAWHTMRDESISDLWWNGAIDQWLLF